MFSEFTTTDRIQVFFSDPHWPEHVIAAKSSAALLDSLGLSFPIRACTEYGILQQIQSPAYAVYVENLTQLEFIRAWSETSGNRPVPDLILGRIRRKFAAQALAAAPTA